MTPGANQAKAIQARRISQLPRNLFGHLQQQHKSEAADEPVPKPQRTRSRATRVAGADNQERRRDPEQLRYDNHHDDAESAATADDTSE